MPNWTKVRANLDSQAGSGFVYLDADAIVGATLGPWVDCELVDCDAVGVGPRVRKDSNGIVYMRASLEMHASGLDLFILPAGYEPAESFGVACFFRRFAGGTGYGLITVGYNGNVVRLQDNSGGALPEFTPIDLGGIAYPTI